MISKQKGLIYNAQQTPHDLERTQQRKPENKNLNMYKLQQRLVHTPEEKEKIYI